MNRALLKIVASANLIHEAVTSRGGGSKKHSPLLKPLSILGAQLFHEFVNGLAFKV